MLKTVLIWLQSDQPRWPYKQIWSHALLAALGISAVGWVIYLSLGISAESFFAENAGHELAQSAVLGMALIAAIIAAIRGKDLKRYAAIATGVVSYAGFFREMPTCRGDITVFCADAGFRGSLMAVGGVAFLLWTALLALRHHQVILKAIHPRLSWPLALSALAIGASQISEELHLVPVEEVLELYSYLILMFGAGWLAFRPLSAGTAGSGETSSP